MVGLAGKGWRLAMILTWRCMHSIRKDYNLALWKENLLLQKNLYLGFL